MNGWVPKITRSDTQFQDGNSDYSQRLVNRFSGGVQFKLKGRTFSGSTFDVEDLVVRRKDVLHDREPKARSASHARPAFINSEKPFRKPTNVLLADSNSLVLN